MIGSEKIKAIRKLLGLMPKAAIARKVGVNREVVFEIAIGIERKRDPNGRARKRDVIPITEKVIARCKTCGCKVEMPCLYCGLQKQQKRSA